MRMFNLFLDAERDWSIWVGHGRIAYDGSMLMSIRQSTGDRLAFRVRINGAERELACQHEQWCRWLAPMIPVSVFYELPDELQQLAILWGMRNIAPLLFQQREVEWLSVTRYKGNDGFVPILTLSDEARRLDIHFIDWPVDELSALTHDWSPATPFSENNLSLCLDVYFGSVLLPISDWLALQPGDGIFIDKTTDLNSYVFALSLQRQLVAQIRAVAESSWEVVMLGSHYNSVKSGENMDVGNIALNVSLQVGTMHIKVNELVSMQSGDIFNAELFADNQVKLVCDSGVIGYGTLIKSNEDERWCVRVNQINE